MRACSFSTLLAGNRLAYSSDSVGNFASSQPLIPADITNTL
jgi:hypothetical protein